MTYPINDLNWRAFFLIILVAPVELMMFALGPCGAPGDCGGGLAIELVVICFVTASRVGPGFFRLDWRGAGLGWMITSSFAVFVIALHRSSPVALAGTFFSMAGFVLPVAVIIQVLRGMSPVYDRVFGLCAAALLPVLLTPVSGGLLADAVRDLRYVYDPALIRFDDLLGLGWRGAFADFMNAFPMAGKTVTLVYECQTYCFIAAAALEAARKPANRGFLMLSITILGLIGFLLYAAMPAIGPAAFWGGLWPDHVPAAGTLAAGPVLTAVPGLRNAMPSLHAASAMLVLLALRDGPAWQRLLGVLLVASTFVSTLGLGEHYMVDWLPAFPLVLLCRGLSAAWLPFFCHARRNATVIGLGLLFCWIAVVRNGAMMCEFPWLLRCLAVVSVLLPLRLERLLARAGDDAAAEGARETGLGGDGKVLAR